MEEDLPVVYQIVDRGGRIYPLSFMADPAFAGSLKLPTGYAQTPVAPRLVASVGDRPLASVSLADVPPALPVSLPPVTDAPIRLVYRGEPWLDAEATRPIPAGERWRIVARRTRFSSTVDAVATLPSGGMRWNLPRLAFPFAGQAGAVEVEIERVRQERVGFVVRLKGLRLTRRFGGTAVVVDRAREFKNALGARIVLPKQDNGPHRPLRHDDPRAATLILGVMPSWWKPPTDGQRPLPRENPPQIDILSPDPASLGLRELRIASGFRRTGAKTLAPLREGPFEAVVRVTLFKPVSLGKKAFVVPVESRPVPLSADRYPRPR